MIDLAALELALAPIELLGKREFPLTIAGTSLVLRPLQPDVERAVQAWSREALQDEKGNEKEDNTHLEMLEYLDRFKLGVLSRAVVQIDRLDLRNVEYISVGVDDEGQHHKRAKHLVLRDLLESKFSRPVLLSLFKAYGDLMARVELETEKQVLYDQVDLQSEIERLTERLRELRALKANQDKPSSDILSQQIKQATDHVTTVRDANRILASQERGRGDIQVVLADEEQDYVLADPEPEQPGPATRFQDDEPGVPAAVQAARRRSSLPDRVPAPSQRVEPEPTPPPAVMDSFSDAGGDAIAVENQRLLQQRKQHMAETGSTVQAARPRQRLPPHRQAANTEDAVLDAGGGQLRRAQAVGTIDGKDAYRLPKVEMSDRRGAIPSQIDVDKAAFNDDSGGGQVNPAFKPKR